MTSLPRHGSAAPPMLATPVPSGAPRMRRTLGGYWQVEWTDAAGKRCKRSFGKGRALARQRYEAWLTEWASTTQARQQQLDRPVTVAEAWERYQAHALVYYRRVDGKQTGEARRIGYAMKPVVALFGTEPAASMTAAKLARARAEMVASGSALGTVNQRVGSIRRVWRWLELQELVPPPVWQSLLALQRLKAGRSDARAPAPIKPADEKAIAAACERMPRSLRTMVQLQLLTGMRPGEVCALRPCDIEKGPGLWKYRPVQHKTLHHGHQRHVRLGRQARELLAPYLDGPADSPAFTPALAMRERALGAAGSSGIPSTAPIECAPTEWAAVPWTVDSYRQAIRHACKAAKVKPWRPNQLRHNAATKLRRLGGLDAAQALLGHRHANVTEIYAEADDEKLAPLLEQIG